MTRNDVLLIIICAGLLVCSAAVIAASILTYRKERREAETRIAASVHQISGKLRMCDPFDYDFAIKIGGYTRGDLVASRVYDGAFYISTKDNNLTDPDSDIATGWVIRKRPEKVGGSRNHDGR
jgi:hypothetical protein